MPGDNASANRHAELRAHIRAVLHKLSTPTRPRPSEPRPSERRDLVDALQMDALQQRVELQREQDDS
jgi:hypothetical protein